MRALLDTNAFLWFCADDRRLSAQARSIISDQDSPMVVSVVVAWEISIKAALNRMPELNGLTPEEYVPSRMRNYDFEPLSIAFTHAFRVAHLPSIHRDPFDRMLIAQAQVEGLPIVTSDVNIARYDVEVIW